MPHVNYEIVVQKPGLPLVIRDIGPWNKCITITNAAEAVVEELCESGVLAKGQRLWYYDSEGELDELLVKDGKFAGYGYLKDAEKRLLTNK